MAVMAAARGFVGLVLPASGAALTSQGASRSSGVLSRSGLLSRSSRPGYSAFCRRRRFAHVGVGQSQLESATSSALSQVQNSGAAQCMVARLPPANRTQELRAVNKDFPFSSHDNRHCLQNVGEYFDLGMGRRKVEPERRQHNSHNFFLWAHEAAPRSEDGFSIYQTSFVKDQNTTSPFRRRYPRHHSEKWCTGKLVPEDENTCSQTSHLNDQNTFVELTYHPQSLFSRAELLVAQMDGEINVCVK